MLLPHEEPILLDTCVLQDLAWVERKIAGGAGIWTDERIAELRARYGRAMAEELFVLGEMWDELQNGAGYFWLVATSSRDEVERVAGAKAEDIRDIFDYFAGHQECIQWAFGWSIAPGALEGNAGRPSPLILRGLDVQTVEEISADDGPLAFLPDLGDRLLVRDALLANVPTILTLDRRSFWRHRARLCKLGVEVVLPTELSARYAASAQIE